MKEVYAWNGDVSSLLLIQWLSPRTDCFADIAPDPRPQPYVVNGQYFMECTDDGNIIKLGDMMASYVCPAPDGVGYNDILEKARAQRLLFTPNEMES